MSYAILLFAGFLLTLMFTETGEAFERRWRRVFRWKLVPQRRPDGTMDFHAPPIMQRMHFFRCPWFEIALHRLLNPDNMTLGLHDHPWDFWSIVVWGWYVERVGGAGFRLRGRFSTAFHRAEYTHAIFRIGAPCYTLVVTSRRKRQWGFPEKGIVVE